MALLTLGELLIESDNDQPVVASVAVGYTTNRSLRIRFTYDNAEKHEQSFIKYVDLSTDEAYAVCRKSGVSLTALPAFIAKKFGVPLEELYSISEARSVFENVLAYVASCGVRVRIRTTAKNF